MIRQIALTLATIVLAATTAHAELYTHKHHTTTCEKSEYSLGETLRAFSLIMKNNGFPPPVIDSTTNADIGMIELNYTEVDTGNPVVIPYFTDLSKCLIYASVAR
jgi:hypothetical protein